MRKSIHTKTISGLLLAALLVVSCGKKPEGRFNYARIKSKLDLTPAQIADFDEITSTHTQMARKAYEDNKGNRTEGRAKVLAIFQKQDNLIGAVLNDEQYAIYAREIKIERGGREKYNMAVIRDQLGLDSIQTLKYNLANEAFYKLLVDNHDNYHGKPEVYLQYYREIDVNRQGAFKEIMTDQQYQQYLALAKEYQVGEKEAY